MRSLSWSIVVGVFVAFAAGCAKPSGTPPTVVVVCVEALRHDYPKLAEAPTLARLIEEGASAEKMAPAFPANSVPNQNAITTGCLPGKSGFVNNRFYDTDLDVDFEAEPGEFSAVFLREPLWATAERQGVPAAGVNWSGFGEPFDGKRSGRTSDASFDMDDNERVDQLIGWLAETGPDAPRLFFLYLDELDDVGHDRGPLAAKTLKAVTTVDSQVARIVEALEAHRGAENSTLLVLGDHGMAPVTRCIYLREFFRRRGIKSRSYASGATACVEIESEQSPEEVKASLADMAEMFDVYLPAEVDELYGGRQRARTADLVLVGKPGTYFRDLEGKDNPIGPPRKPGMHGYPPSHPDMMASFIAWGRGVAPGAKLGEIRIVDVYPTVCKLLGLKGAADIDGKAIPGVGDGAVAAKAHGAGDKAAKAKRPTKRSTDAPWFTDIVGAHAVSADEGSDIAAFVADSLFAGKAKPAEPKMFSTDDKVRIVFLSLSEGTGRARVVRGAGRGMRAAVEQALERARDLPSPRWLTIDIVQFATFLPPAKDGDDLDFERSLEGLAFARESGLAFLPGELVAASIVDSDDELNVEKIRKYLAHFPDRPAPAEYLAQDEFVTLFRFKTAAYFSDGSELVPLYRGHRMFDELSREDLSAAAVSGGDYLKRSVDPDGRFAYKYWPRTDKVSKSYNILRHAGTTYSMLEVYEHTKDPEMLAAAERALGYLSRTSFPLPGSDGELFCVVEKGYVKVGGNGLAIVALSKHMEVTGEREWLPLAHKLARWLQSVQDKDGQFYVHKQSFPDGEPDDHVSQYYPGEALLALARLHAIDKDEGWLDTAEKGAQWLINVRDKGRPDSQLPHDHWLLYALNDLYRYRPRPLYLKHAERITRTILRAQNRKPRAPNVDWLGSYMRPPRSTPAATRSEGLGASYLLTRDYGRAADLPAILDAIQLGIRFQLQAQIRPETAMYLPNPRRAMGGFKLSLTTSTVQIDYPQHSISSLLLLHRILGEAR